MLVIEIRCEVTENVAHVFRAYFIYVVADKLYVGEPCGQGYIDIVLFILFIYLFSFT